MDVSVLWRMLRMMKAGFARYLLAIIAMSIALAGFDITAAMLLKSVLYRAQTYEARNMFTGLPRELLVCVLMGMLLLLIYALAFYVYTMEAKKGGANLQKLVYSKCLRLPYAYYENTHSSEFLSKVLYDCERAQGIYGSRFRRVIMPFLMTIFYLIPMFLLSWQVTICLFGASGMLLIVNAVFVKPMKKISGNMSDMNKGVTEKLSTILSGMEQIKIFSLESMMVKRCMEDNEKFRGEQAKMNRMSAGLNGLNQLFELLGSLVFIALGVFFVGIELTTVDRLAAVYVLYGSMSWNLLQVGHYIPSMAAYLVNAKRVFAFLETEEEALDAPASKDMQMPVGNQTSVYGTANGEAAISMRDIAFSYDGRREVLHHFRLEIAQGKCVALKGESGKGKSTIAKLLLGLYPVMAGKIYLEGKAYESYSLREIRDRIGYVPQEPYLYDVSIAENIRYGRPDAGEEEIVEAAKLANAHEFILQLEDGYATRAGERGNHLSGGQRQRIAIARAILKDAPILILDEATSALDHQSEQAVNEALERLMRGRTTVVIAHRQSTLEYADEIVTM